MGGCVCCFCGCFVYGGGIGVDRILGDMVEGGIDRLRGALEMRRWSGCSGLGGCVGARGVLVWGWIIWVLDFVGRGWELCRGVW